jgi:hypothetical protein
MTAPADIYQVASGQPIYGGRAAPVVAAGFDGVTSFDSTDGPPTASQNGQILVFSLHGSGGSNVINGRQYRATVSGFMALSGTTPANANLPYDAHNTFGFSTVVGFDTTKLASGKFVMLRVADKWVTENGAVMESAHDGFLLADGKVHLVSERRYDALLDWADTNLTMFDQTKRLITGGSMGGWGSISFGVPRYNRFAAIYPDRPRWRYGYTMGTVSVPTWSNGFVAYPVENSPLLAAEDGGKTYGQHRDMIAYVANTANKVRWIGWCVGKNDGYTPFQDHIDAVAALRAGKRGFAFYWNLGDHSTGSQPQQITQSYPYGTFEIGKGYPLFTDHSLDKDPAVDDVGGINIGLSFRNVVETSAGWSCEVTNVLGACTVKVEPISETFRVAVAKQTVTILAANNWVPVSFAA